LNNKNPRIKPLPVDGERSGEGFYIKPFVVY
jgi:hypothetical protein